MNTQSDAETIAEILRRIQDAIDSTNDTRKDLSLALHDCKVLETRLATAKYEEEDTSPSADATPTDPPPNPELTGDLWDSLEHSAPAVPRMPYGIDPDDADAILHSHRLMRPWRYA